MDLKSGIPLAFLLALASTAPEANAVAVTGEFTDLLKAGGLKPLLERGTVNDDRARRVREERIRLACSYNYWRRC